MSVVAVGLNHDVGRLAGSSVIAALGFAPISCLALALFGLLPLHLSAPWLAFGLPLVLIALGFLVPSAGRAALIGFVAGIIATSIYDASRFAIMTVLNWRDFIPVIGELILRDADASPMLGYLYRYLGNGGGMGLTFGVIFAVLTWFKFRPHPLLGTIFGLSICLALFATLILAPQAQALVFVLTPATATGAVIGHLVYGTVLGVIFSFAYKRMRAARPAKT